MDVPDLDEALVEKIVRQSDEQTGALSIRELERLRDDNLVAIIQALAVQRGGSGWGAGALLREHEARLRAAERAACWKRGGAAAACRRVGAARVDRLQRPHDRKPLSAGLRRDDRRATRADRRRCRLRRCGAQLLHRRDPHHASRRGAAWRRLSRDDADSRDRREEDPALPSHPCRRWQGARDRRADAAARRHESGRACRAGSGSGETRPTSRRTPPARLAGRGGSRRRRR